jgi:peroxiredoxin
LSVDSAQDALAMKNEYGLEFPVLYDADTSVTTEWGLFDLLGDGVSAPATFVIRTDGSIETQLVGSNIGERPSTNSLLEVLASLAGMDSSSLNGQPGGGSGGESDTAMSGDAMDGMEDAVTVQPTAVPEVISIGSPAIGDLVPDFNLPTARGDSVSLSEYAEDRNVVLVFFRAWW